MSRFVAIAALYFAQGLPFGFFSHAVPTLLNRSQPAHIVGLSSLLAVPWGLKFLWAPLVDRWSRGGVVGRRRVIVPLQLATVALLLALAWLPVESSGLRSLALGFFVVSVLSATQDIATDALSIDLLLPSERGLGGGIQAGAYRVGMIAGGGGVLALIDQIGLREGFALMAALVALSTLPLVLLRGESAQSMRPVEQSPSASGPSVVESLLGFARRPGTAAFVGALVCFKLGDALAAGMVTRLFVQAGLTNSEIALYRGISGGIASVLGALVAGGAARWWGLRTTLVGAASLQSLAIVLYLVAALYVGHVPRHTLHVLSVVEHLFGGAATAALFAAMMQRCRSEARGTDFTVQASVLVAISGFGIAVSGFVVSLAGLAALFAVASLAGAAAPFAARTLGREQ